MLDKRVRQALEKDDPKTLTKARGATPLHELLVNAAMMDATACLEQLLREPEAARLVNAPYGAVGATALFGAKSARAADLLLAAGARVDVVAAHARDTALHLAAAFGELKVIDRLVAAGAPLEHADAEGLTPLGRAVKYGKVPAVERLLAAGARPDPLDAVGRSVLARATGITKVDARWRCVELLLAAGADPRAGSPSALEAAAQRALSDPKTQQLLQGKAKPNMKGAPAKGRSRRG